MLSRSVINKLIIITFLGLVGFCLARAIYYGSFWGIALALISLGAGVYFLYILVKTRTAAAEAETDNQV